MLRARQSSASAILLVSLAGVSKSGGWQVPEVRGQHVQVLRETARATGSVSIQRLPDLPDACGLHGMGALLEFEAAIVPREPDRSQCPLDLRARLAHER